MALTTDSRLWGVGYHPLGDGTPGTRLVAVPVATNGNQMWAAVSAGESHTLALATNGTLWAWGDNFYGQLGDGTIAERLAPIPVATNLNRTWLAVSAGGGDFGIHTVALATDGTLWAWGRNNYGQLGDGTTTQRLAPVPVATNVNRTWAAVSAGAHHTVALATDGMLWAWGWNQAGQLGDGTTTNRPAPVPVATNLNATWVAVSAGNAHTVALATDGTLWAWGYNFHGQLGDGTLFNDRLTPVPVVTNLNRTWLAASAGGAHTLALATNGTLWAWGYNFFGQLGDSMRGGDRPTPVPVATNLNRTWAAVSAGEDHTLALATDGTLWAWGLDDEGVLGIDPWRQLLGGAVWGPPP